MSDFTFDGFEPANTTPVPDVLFDVLLPHLNEAQLKVMLYIIRRTLGFKKTSDAISLKQFRWGITTKDKKKLDDGCGLKNFTTISKALKSLEQMHCIERDKRETTDGDQDTTVYRVLFRGTTANVVPTTPTVVGVLQQTDDRPTPTVVGVLRQLYPQETVIQQTVIQESITVLPPEPPQAKKNTGVEINSQEPINLQVLKSTPQIPEQVATTPQHTEPLVFPVPTQQPATKRKPIPPKDESLQTKINEVYATFDNLLQEVSEDTEAKYARTKSSTEAIKEFLSCKPSPEKLRMVYLDLWESPVSQNGFLWREHMSIAAISRNYTQRLASLRDKKRQATKPDTEQKKVGNYYVIG